MNKLGNNEKDPCQTAAQVWENARRSNGFTSIFVTKNIHEICNTDGHLGFYLRSKHISVIPTEHVSEFEYQNEIDKLNTIKKIEYEKLSWSIRNMSDSISKKKLIRLYCELDDCTCNIKQYKRWAMESDKITFDYSNKVREVMIKAYEMAKCYEEVLHNSSLLQGGNKMKYNDLPERWKKRAVEMEINLLNSLEDEAARENGTVAVQFTAEDIEVLEAINVTEYSILKDEITGAEFLERVLNFDHGGQF